MAGTNTEEIDTNTAHDHNYYGNGCTPGYADGGSAVACSYRLVPADNNEEQLIGVYYNNQAATSGSGSAISTDNAIIPDSFCPLGWQLPYSGTGGDYYDKSKSWRYISTLYHFDQSVDDMILRKYPFSYIGQGYYFWQTGRLYSVATNDRVGFGRFWSSTKRNGGEAYALLGPQVSQLTMSDAIVAGNALRCIFHRRHGGRNACRFKDL